MLQQILHNMYVDPEILAELDDNQKQTLFCKMREEQVRRWTAWNDKSPNESTAHKPRSSSKQVSFLKGQDGEPWVWVMGEHENDQSIEDILRMEAAEEARKLAEKETAKMREEVRMNAQLISDYVDLSPKIEELPLPALRIEDDMDIYCSVEEIQAKIHHQSKPRIIDNYTLNHYPTRSKFSFSDKGNQQEKNNTQNVAQRVALWEKKFLNDKTCEIFQKIQRKQQQVAQEAEEEEKRKEKFWKEQERKAKEAEQQIREIARRAREEHKLNSSSSPCRMDTSCNTSLIGGAPPGRNAVLEWYRNEEKSRLAGLDSDKNALPWFHGLITRQNAEKLLLDQSCGSFLVRLSEKIWGYAISYRAKEKCKHYLVSAVPKYSFIGNNQIEHDTLGEMISFHQKQPLTGGETLEHPCPRFFSEAIDELLECSK
ncbi:unnamed protein product [Phaedon cochleariae]|uniref:SH2 domain-containing protein n=1 Tax=Phaedon cochleariae TaxID=80249 RepID=A0A9P0D7H4_PHACE|nr:unnamed protein product [Phaedon cochleariae]